MPPNSTTRLFQNTELPCQKTVLKNKISEEDVFRYAMYLILIYLFLILTQFPAISRYLDTRNLPTSFSEYLYAFPFSIFSFLLFQFNRTILIPKIKHIFINSNKSQNPSDLNQYYNKTADYLSGFIHYTISFVLMSLVAVRSQILPCIVGGSLNLKIIENIQPREMNFEVKFAFMFAFGHHFERLVSHLLSKHKSHTYYTMLNHHVCTIGVMMLAYHMKYLLFGVPVVVLFDLSDSFLQISRFLRETKFRATSEVGVLLMMVSWFIMRILAFFYEILLAVLFGIFMGQNQYFTLFPMTHVFFFISLFLLFLLNCFWFYQIVKVFVVWVVLKSDKIEYEDKIHSEKNQ